MPETIHTISLPFPFRMGWVNCYLIETGACFALIDTGSSSNRKELDRELDRLGCQVGLLKLIILTHGDFDHTGNAAYLRSRFEAPIAMHSGDLGMAEDADMFFNRSKGNALLKALVPRFSGFRQADRFTPDFTLHEGDDLSPYGLDATVSSIPGHSKGSIGILTAGGDFFCGDLLISSNRPALNSLIDDATAANTSLERLRQLSINRVYPGHGKPFRLDELQERSAEAG